MAIPLPQLQIVTEAKPAALASSSSSSGHAMENEPLQKKSKMVPEKSNSNCSNDPEKVKIKVVGQDGSEIFFLLNRENKLQKVFQLYCKKTSQVHEDMQFIYKGNRIYGFHTPQALRMKKNKTIIIDAIRHVHGGGRGEELHCTMCL